MHRRTAIRNAVATRLAAALPDATVSRSRLHAWQPAQLPGVAVYTLNEPVERLTLARHQQRTLDLVIDVHVATTGDVDTETDDLCVGVEQAMEADPRFAGLAKDSFLAATEIGLSGEADQRHGLARLTYTIVYHTPPGQPA